MTHRGLLALAAILASTAPAAAGEGSSVTGAPVSADGVTVKAELRWAPGPDAQPQPLRLGDRAELVLEVEAPNGAAVFPPRNPSLGSFEIAGTLPDVVRTPLAEGAREVHVLPVLAMRVGAEAIPKLEIPYRLADGKSGTLETPRLRVRVLGHLGNEQDPALGAAPAAVPVVSTNWTLVWLIVVLGAALAAAVLTLVVMRLLRDRLLAGLPKPPPPPANVVAFGKLDALAVAELEPQARQAGAIDVLREYLGSRYAFDGLETTTVELLDRLREADLKAITRPEIAGLLDEADLVKFARYAPTDAQARERIHDVRRVVELTWEEPEEAEEPDEVVRLDPASALERVKAGLVDAGLAAAVAGAALGGLWVSGLSDWGWLAVLVFGVLLFGRDLAGPGSPGKALLALRVVTSGDRQEPPSIGARLTRNALLLAAPVGLPAETLVLLYHPLRQRLGDRWAGTEVVRATPPRPSPARRRPAP